MQRVDSILQISDFLVIGDGSEYVVHLLPEHFDPAPDMVGVLLPHLVDDLDDFQSLVDAEVDLAGRVPEVVDYLVHKDLMIVDFILKSVVLLFHINHFNLRSFFLQALDIELFTEAYAFFSVVHFLLDLLHELPGLRKEDRTLLMVVYRSPCGHHLLTRDL